MSFTGAPSTSTVSPRSSAMSVVRYSSVAFQVIGFWPSTNRPVKPVPSAATARPGASCSSVAIAAALVTTWRNEGTSTAGSEADGRRHVGAPGERHPDVAVEGGGVEDPGPAIAELLGEADQVGKVGSGREGTAEFHGGNL